MEDNLDDLSGVPRYMQVARIIEREILDGVWRPGFPVPSQSQLHGRFGIAATTAAKAHDWLVNHGYVAPVPGVGMVVRPHRDWPELPDK